MNCTYCCVQHCVVGCNHCNAKLGNAMYDVCACPVHVHCPLCVRQCRCIRRLNEQQRWGWEYAVMIQHNDSDTSCMRALVPAERTLASEAEHTPSQPPGPYTAPICNTPHQSALPIHLLCLRSFCFASRAFRLYIFV